MGRMLKKGVDYFPHDTDASSRMTIQALEMRYGSDGYAAWYKLLETLGRTDSLSIDCKNLQERVYLVRSLGFMEDRAMEILDYMAELEAIDKELWNMQKVIWSQNFADRLISTVFKKRKDQATPRKPALQNGQPVEITQPKDHISQANETSEPPSAADDYPFGLTDEEIRKSLDQDAAIEDAAQSYGLPCYEGNMITARELARQYSLEWLIEAIKRAGEGKSQTWNYVRGILQNWADQGYMDKPGDRRRQAEPNPNALDVWGGTL